ncbi:hypothetical protein HUSEC_26975 [Escherichia coli O104:H4 str. LB226692]|uniref:Uncharacterized protein n=1 Tax=Escherichia coli (strain 55989 / EAEC) TaxID=585055 RepID=B7LDP7_ECO55|nr:hypothetical protein HUSEC41_26585 [Escherichia coli O104:H4 str. 01-09591]EGR71602.1 hypothetical protein HUSEC_26975 [Escherichia coli O104:H4 str. LB226692]CAV01957.1 hypothetical protein EC55989_4907 [Escherichia coli 55989]
MISCGLIGVYVMPMASPFYLLIGVGLIGIDVISLASKAYFPFYLYIKGT